MNKRLVHNGIKHLAKASMCFVSFGTILVVFFMSAYRGYYSLTLVLTMMLGLLSAIFGMQLGWFIIDIEKANKK